MTRLAFGAMPEHYIYVEPVGGSEPLYCDGCYVAMTDGEPAVDFEEESLCLECAVRLELVAVEDRRC